MSSSRLQAEEPEEEGGASAVDAESFAALQEVVGGMQQEHERLMGTAAHLSHELEVNKEHVKVQL